MLCQDLLKSEESHPFYQSYFNDIKAATVLSEDKIRFDFARQNRELHLIACELPILSKKYYAKQPFSESSLSIPIGSGPYIVDKIIPGKSISYIKNSNYWAKSHPVRKNMFNFQTITHKYYKDQLVSVEAFKSGDFDFMYVNIAKQWARDLVGDKFESKQIIKEYLDHKNNAGMQCFVMNTRKELFSDINVRQAIGLAFDFEWTNKTLFFDQYTQTDSYFSNSKLAANGLPQGLELHYLNEFKDKLPIEVFSQPLTMVSTAPPNSLRGNLRKAKQLLEQSGWTIQDGILVKNSDPNQEFKFEIVLASPSFERVMAPFVKNLEKLGILATYRTIDPALYTRRLKSFDFDMLVNVFGQSQSPGNEQRSYWHSSAAEQTGSRNLIGLKDPVVDALVDKIIYATTQIELEAACKALDRVLWYGYYVVPNWYVARHRVVYWNKFKKPEKLPLYYQPDEALMTWWMAD
nr:ABC transporter substrate-binding protein [Desulfobulbaceae bacterium]